MEKIFNLFWINKSEKLIKQMEELWFFEKTDNEEVKEKVKAFHKENKKIIIPEELWLSIKKENIDIFWNWIKESLKNLIVFWRKFWIEIKITNYSEKMLDNLKYKKIASINKENFVIFEWKIDSEDKFDVALRNLSRIMLRLWKKSWLKNDFYVRNNEEIIYLSDKQKEFLEKINWDEIKI